MADFGSEPNPRTPFADNLHPFPPERIQYAHGLNDSVTLIWAGHVAKFTDPGALVAALALDVAAHQAKEAAAAAQDARRNRRAEFLAAPRGARLAFVLADSPVPAFVITLAVAGVIGAKLAQVFL